MYQIITTERLELYRDMVKEYDYLLEQKKKIELKINSVKGVDYSKDKVMNGGSQSSQPEIFTEKLERINKQITEIAPKVKREHEEIKVQIARIKKWNFRKVLVLRYLEKWKWSEIIQEFFWQEDDYEDEKNLKYKDKILVWHRQGLAELQKISNKPFIKVEQLRIEIK